MIFISNHKSLFTYIVKKGFFMCGIAGFCDFKRNLLKEKIYNTTLLKQMHSSLSHRGHDNFGTYLKESVGLSHARLSIRDIQNGAQPMIRRKEQNEYAICYNGEIYNTDELRQELLENGYYFSTSSDTEIIINCFIEYGPSFVSKLNGIFSFAIWDENLNQLYLYRDRVGVKPLFYYFKSELLVFASEPKAVFLHPQITPSINLESLQQILGIGPARLPGSGYFSNIKEVLPGHYLTINRYGICNTKYWDLYSKEHEDSYDKTVEKVRYLVYDSIKRQMISDVPVCTFLSGGLDSSIVTALAYKYMTKEQNVLNTFSFDFTQNDIYFKSNSFQPERDLPYVNIMLEKYPTNHKYLECDETQLYNALFESVVAKDMPGMADVDASLLHFCKEVSKDNKVALTGECADEIFGGYPWFYRPSLMNQNGFPWSYDIDARQSFLNDAWIKKLDLSDYAHSIYVDSINNVPSLDSENEDEKRRRQISYLNIKWFMQTLLDRMDRASMYSGLEARVPFADHRIIEYLFNVPWSMKYQNNQEKSLLRKATKELLPDKLVNRKKSPYPKTYHPGYETLLKLKILEISKDKTSPIKDILDIAKINEAVEANSNYIKPWFGQLMAGPQLFAYYIQLDYWMRKFKLELP